jgi:hypothetical protein
MRVPVTSGYIEPHLRKTLRATVGHEVYVVDTSAVGAPQLIGKTVLRDWAVADSARPALSEFLSSLDIRDEALPHIKIFVQSQS